ncbi:MAG: hypothetical protein L6R41_000508 [Letrouitia leprolyta]|nr:MAG: hypothetical protein L6R41_000508 [Letrouitia leprolyta]
MAPPIMKGLRLPYFDLELSASTPTTGPITSPDNGPAIHTKEVLLFLKRMLRRKPTAIILTSEDVAAYEDSRTAKAHSTAENERSNKEAQSGTHDPNDELKPLPGDKSRAVRNGQSRDERIGVTR